MSRICFHCEHCEAVEKDDDLVLCCMLHGEENPREVAMRGTCSSYSESVFIEVLLDASGVTRCGLDWVV